MPLQTGYLGYSVGEQYQSGNGIKATKHKSGLIDINGEIQRNNYTDIKADSLIALTVRINANDAIETKREIEKILDKNGVDYKSGDITPDEPFKFGQASIPRKSSTVTFSNIPYAKIENLANVIVELEKNRFPESLKIEDDIEPPTTLNIKPRTIKK